MNNIGLGCVTFGREIDRAGAFAMMAHALAHGITLFDTAAAYGGGASETIVGEWLAQTGARERVTLATKILPPFTPASIEAAVAASLARLKVAVVDQLFLHRWDESINDVAALRALDAVVRSGRVRRVGASNFSAAQLATTLALQLESGLTRISCLQSIHNFAVRGLGGELLTLCAQNEIALVTYSPLGAGFLTGKHEGGVQPGSRFDLIRGHQDIYFNDLARQRLARLKSVSERASVPMTTLALAWALNQSHGGTVLVGGRSPAHLDQALYARAFADLARLRELDAE